MSLRYYKTTRSRPIDYMYQLNTPLMEKVLTANEGYIGQELAQADKLGQLATYEHLQGDEEDAMAITQAYNDRVSDITSKIRSNPAAWRDQTSAIRTLGKDLQADYTTGAINKQLGNYNQRKAAFDAIDKQVEAGKINPQAASLYKAHWDKKFNEAGGKTAFDPNTRAYNVYQGGTAMHDVDVQKALTEGLDKIKADKSKHYRTDEYGNGWMYNEVTQSEEMVTPDRILAIASDRIPSLMPYLRERSDIGEISGVFTEDGKYISPYTHEKTGLSPQEEANIKYNQEIINKATGDTKRILQEELKKQVEQLKAREYIKYNEDSYLTPFLRGAVNTYAYSDIESGNKLSNNQRGPTVYNQAHQDARQAAQLAQAWKIHDETMKATQKRFDETMAQRKYEFDNPHAKTTGTGAGTGVKTPAGQVVPQIESSTSMSALRSFEAWETDDKTTGQKVKVLSNAGLSNRINDSHAIINSIDADLKEVNKRLANATTEAEIGEITGEKQSLMVRKQQAESDLGSYRTWYNGSTEATLQHDPKSGVTLSDTDVQLYKDFASDRDGSKLYAELKKSREEDAKADEKKGQKLPYLGTLAPSETVKTVSNKTLDLSKKYTKYLNVKKTVDAGRENVLTNMRNDVIDSDVIQPGAADGQAVANVIFNNPQGLQIFDHNLQDVSKADQLEGTRLHWWSSSSSDNYSPSFEGGKDSGLNLADYIKANNVKVNVEQVGNTVKLGTKNAVVKVSFEDKEGELPSTPFYITVSDAVNSQISNIFKNNKNKDVADIGQAIGNDFANNVRNQLINPSINQALDRQGLDPNNFNIFVTDRKGVRVPLRVMTTIDGGRTHYTVTGRDKDGVEQAFPRVDKGTAGSFNGPEDFIKNLRLAGYGQ